MCSYEANKQSMSSVVCQRYYSVLVPADIKDDSVILQNAGIAQIGL